MCRTVGGLVLVGVILELVACSGSGSVSAAGGSTSSAGAPAGSGGSAAVGGDTTSSGGDPTTTGTGGASSPAGGSLGTGGTTLNPTATGGAPTGGSSSKPSSATGGVANTGGSRSAAGATSTGGNRATGGATVAGGAVSTGGTTTNGGAGTGGAATSAVSVLQHHNHASRDGVYVDAALTKTAAASLHIDTAFPGAMLSGPTYAQPLYLASSGSGPALAIAVTEQNRVYAFNAATGAQVYNVLLGTPLPRAQLACGNIDPLGITGTPVIDETTRTIYLDAMTSVDATAANARHLVYALNASGSTTFKSVIQNQRGALMLLGGKVFVPFGGHLGDCSDYHGWIVGISTTDPTQVSAWATRALAGGVWAPGGISSDGTSLFFATGNTEANANSFAPPGTWQDGETIFRLAPSLAHVTATTDYFVPTNWSAMDQADADLGGTNPIVFDVAGATPSGLVIGLGKDGKAYVLNRANLGGVSAPLAGATVSSGAIINAAAAYSTPSGAYVVFKGSGSGCPSGQSGGLTAIKIGASSPPTVSVAWCGGPSTQGSPSVSMSNAAGQDSMVWIVGTDNKLHGLDGVTGASVFGGGATTDTMSAVQKFETPIVANGRIFVTANNQMYAFSM